MNCPKCNSENTTPQPHGGRIDHVLVDGRVAHQISDEILCEDCGRGSFVNPHLDEATEVMIAEFKRYQEATKQSRASLVGEGFEPPAEGSQPAPPTTEEQPQ